MLRTARLQRERLRWRVGLSRQELAPGRGRTARRDHKTRTDPVVPVLGTILLILLSRAQGGYKDGDSDIPAAQLEKERKEGQAKLVLLSSDGEQVIVHSGHNMNLEAPAEVSSAIHEVVDAVRLHHRLKTS